MNTATDAVTTLYTKVPVYWKHLRVAADEEDSRDFKWRILQFCSQSAPWAKR